MACTSHSAIRHFDLDFSQVRNQGVWEVWEVWEDGEEVLPPTLPTLPTLPCLQYREKSGFEAMFQNYTVLGNLKYKV